MRRQYTYQEALTCVDTLCRAILGRPAEGDGWIRYAKALENGERTEEDIGIEFITSPEFRGRGKLQALTQPDREPIFIQTADAVVYRELLQVTSKTVIAYCQRHRLKYESYTGIKRGVWPWHATYNRLFILKELIDRGLRGWAVYMDADAYIVDQDFDLRQYLSDKADYALIGVFALGHGDSWIPGNGAHNVNAGVLLINLGHPVGREFVAEWHRRYMDIPDYIVRQAEIFEAGMSSDQELLQLMLMENQHYVRHLHHESPHLINSRRASFIRQHLRAMHSSFAERLAAITLEVDAAMGARAG